MATESRVEDWLPAGEEPHATGSITHCAILRNDGICNVSLPSGEIDAAAEPATGVYFRDTRFISKLCLSFGGVAPVLLDSKQLPFALTAIFTNPAMRLPNGQVLPRQTLIMRRQRVLDDGLLEVLSISNYYREAVDLELRVAVEADFHDIFEVRGFERPSQRPAVRHEETSDAIMFASDGRDNLERRCRIGFVPAPSHMDGAATFLLHLEPRATAEVEMRAFFESGQAMPDHGRAGLQAAARVNRQQREWLDASTRIVTDNEVLNAALDRSLLDVRALETMADGMRFVAAGAPWFDTLFGRDSLITGMELAAIQPDVLRQALQALARHQATETDPVHDAEPGKIPHELRWGELANAGDVPFGRYFGSVDATPLFVMAADEYLRWTGDLATIEGIWPSLERAIAWCRQCQDRTPDGLLAYARVSVAGLEHQGWKDSSDGISWPDGSPVEPPISLVEVQGYLAAAYAAFARLAKTLERDSGDAAERMSATLEHLESRFSDPGGLGYALCVEGSGEPVMTRASNAGHLLWTGAADPRQAAEVVRTLMEPDLFSGWGVRTLSSKIIGFNPIGYHTGSVWPHDNALILAGFRRYGFDADAQRLGSALLEMAMAFPDYQVPELFSGDRRELRVVPTPYPVSSRPQAWSAASVPFTVISLLGIEPLPGDRISVTRPVLPEWVHWLEVKNLRAGQGTVDLLFTNNDGHIAVEVENIRGDMEVVLSQSVRPPMMQI